MNTPELTVALPVYQGARHLAETLRAVLADDSAAVEYLVVDDGSVDGSLDIARDILGTRARLERNPERLGLAGNWNRCAKLARTQFIAIIHQDDRPRPGHCKVHLDALKADPSLGMTFSAVGIIDDRGQAVSPARIDPGGLGEDDRRFPPSEFTRCLVAGNPVRCSSVVLRVAAVESVDGFDPEFKYAVDWDFWARLSRRWAVRWLNQVTMDVRWHPASETHRFARGLVDLEEVERVVRAIDFINGPAWTPQARRRLHDQTRRFLARAYWNRAYVAARARRPGLMFEALGRALKRRPELLGSALLDPRFLLLGLSAVVRPSRRSAETTTNSRLVGSGRSIPPDP